MAFEATSYVDRITYSRVKNSNSSQGCLLLQSPCNPILVLGATPVGFQAQDLFLSAFLECDRLLNRHARHGLQYREERSRMPPRHHRHFIEFLLSQYLFANNSQYSFINSVSRSGSTFGYCVNLPYPRTALLSLSILHRAQSIRFSISSEITSGDTEQRPCVDKPAAYPLLGNQNYGSHKGKSAASAGIAL